MAVCYCDFEAGSDTNGGTTWADAEKTLQAAVTTAGAGGTVYVRRTNAGTPTDNTVNASVTLTSAGTALSPTVIIGCKDGTTAEPPVEADVAIRGTDTLPVYGAITTSSNDVTIIGYLFVRGIRFTYPDRCQPSSSWLWLTGCELYGTTASSAHIYGAIRVRAIDCEFNGGYVFIPAGGDAKLYDCIISGTSTSYIIRGTGGTTELYGCDLSGSAANPITQPNGTILLKMANCRLKSGYTMVPTTEPNYDVEMVGCSSAAVAKDSDTSYQNYEHVTYYGDVDATTFTRAGGGDDGTTGGDFAYALTPQSARTHEGYLAIYSPWISVWVDGGTAITATIYIANNTGADLTEDEAWVELLHPDAGDTAQHTFTAMENTAGSNARFGLAATPAAITDDTVSNWNAGGAGTSNAQKFTSASFTPGYTGWVYARVAFAQSTDGTKILYVDPEIEVT